MTEPAIPDTFRTTGYNTVPWEPPPLARAAATVEISPRLADVLTGLAHGLQNKDIARRLNVSEDTVKTHVKKILRALGARDRTHATALAVSGQIAIVVRPNARGRRVA